MGARARIRRYINKSIASWRGVAGLSSLAVMLFAAPLSAAEQRLVVLGDSLGNGVYAGLYHEFRKQKDLKVIKKSKVATGIVRDDYYDWIAQTKALAESEQIDMAVIVIGANDRQTIQQDGKRYRLLSDGWKQIYTDRIITMTKTLQEKGTSVYWIGLPIMRQARYGNDIKAFNAIYHETAKITGATYIDSWDYFADENGEYSAYGFDLEGRMRKLRDDDGIHMTMRGYSKLADLIKQHMIYNRDYAAGTATGIAIEPKISVEAANTLAAAQTTKPITEPTRKLALASTPTTSANPLEVQANAPVLSPKPPAPAQEKPVVSASIVGSSLHAYESGIIQPARRGRADDFKWRSY